MSRILVIQDRSVNHRHRDTQTLTSLIFYQLRLKVMLFRTVHFWEESGSPNIDMDLRVLNQLSNYDKLLERPRKLNYASTSQTCHIHKYLPCSWYLRNSIGFECHHSITIRNVLLFCKDETGLCLGSTIPNGMNFTLSNELWEDERSTSF